MNVNGVAISLVNEKRLLFLPLWFIPVCTNGERTIRGNDSIQAFFCSDISVKHSSLHSQKPLWFLSRYVSLSTTLSSNLISTWNRANRCLFLLSELFFYIFLGCLLVVLCSCAILSKTSWFHAANKNEQRTPTSIFRDGTTLKSDMQKYPKGKFEKNNVKTLNKLEKAQKKL